MTSRTTGGVVPRGEVDRDELPLGQCVGRLVVLRRRGRGGMGIVYEAYDPELDRKVALKALRERSGPDAAGRRARLLHEARAAARLAHPNVVGVFDVYEEGERVCLAMELVEGEELGAWVRGRPWREVVGAFLGAGAGLAAAHRAGLVHCDFKPANAIVGRDGRVRVLDFGLARLASPESDRDPLAAASAPRGFVGTPVYAAPEVHAGAPASALSDQYAFCVALWEALLGGLPFRAGDLDELGAEKSRGPRTPGELRGVPSALAPALLRGLSAEPGRRFPTMEALLAALAARARPRWRRVAAVLGALALVGVAAGLTVSLAAGDPCVDEPEQLRAVYSPERRAAVRAALAARADPSSADAALRALDRYARGWAEARRESCEATFVARSQSSELLDRRGACLQRRLDELDALLRQFEAEGPDAAATAAAAAAATGHLTDLGRCTSASVLAELTDAPPPERARAAEALQRELTEVEAMTRAGRYAAAAARARAALADAERLAWPPLVAEAQLRLGDVLDYTGERDAAGDALAAALGGALRSGQAALAADAASLLVFLDGYRRRRLDAAAAWREVAAALLARRGDDGRTAAELASRWGAALEAAGSLEAARDAYVGALRRLQALLGPRDLVVADTHNNLGNLLRQLGDADQALVHLELAAAIRGAELGPAHPRSAEVRNAIGVLHLGRGRLDEAEEALVGAVRDLGRGLGEAHPTTLNARHNLAFVASQRGDLDRALALHAAILADRRAQGQGEGLAAARTHESLAGLLVDRGDLAAAAEHARAAEAIVRRQVGERHVEMVAPLAALGRLARAEGRCVEAADLLRRALELLGGGDELRALPRLVDLGDALRCAGDPAGARAAYERGAELVARRPGAAPSDQVRLRVAFARLLREEGDGDAERRELAALAALGPHPLASEAAALLAARPG